MALTLDELGSDWERDRLHLTLQSTWNDRKVGLCETGPVMKYGDTIRIEMKGRDGQSVCSMRHRS